MRRRLGAVAGAVALAASCAASEPSIILEGTIVTPLRVIARGWIEVRGSRIGHVLEEPPPAGARAAVVDVGGTIFPGLIDLHNHLTWNVLSRWTPRRTYANRYEWRSAYEYTELIAAPAQRLQQRHACDLREYGELRALVDGTTAMQTSSRAACPEGLVRNLDERFDEILDISRVPDGQQRRTAQRLTFGLARAVFVHLAEGRTDDPMSRDEFARLESIGLLGPRTVIIHGTALGDDEFAAMARAGASLVWSPQSNLTLYGQTTDVVAAARHGVRIALAPDWSLTGGSSVLDELRFVARLNHEQLGGQLSDEQLVQMVTTVPAAIAGLGGELGEIHAGRAADLVVIRSRGGSPYRTLIDAQPGDIRLVIVDGAPLYGDAELMARLVGANQLDPVSVCGASMAVRVSPALGTRQPLGSLIQRLKDAIGRQGPWLNLAPLAVC